MPAYILQRKPFPIPTTDGKRINEHFGLAATGHDAFSVAHMIAPPGWSEPPQQPEFDEVTIMISGRKQVEVDGETIILQPGDSLLINAGATVRYANPFEEPADYWSLCVPAFSLERVHRHSDDA